MILKVNVNYLLMTLLCFLWLDTSASDLNEDLEEIRNWTFKWKMNFNPDPNNKLKKLYLVRRKLPHCTQLFTLIINQLNQHKTQTSWDDA